MWIDTLIPKVSIPEGRSGPWSIKHIEIEDSPVMRFRERSFEPGRYTQLCHDRRGLVMSDTPAERLDHAPFVRAASGDVLIGDYTILDWSNLRQHGTSMRPQRFHPGVVAANLASAAVVQSIGE
jgi:hypothetical protein